MDSGAPPPSQVAVLVASSKDDSVYVIDPTSGTQLALLKNCTSDVGGVALITRSFPGSSGDFVVAAQRDRMLLHFWSWQKEQPVLKCHTPEKIGPLAVTHNGAFCFGGGKSGKIYIWEVCSGRLLRFWDAHFKAVATLSLLADDSHLISSGDDALISVWRLCDLLDSSDVFSDGFFSVRPLRCWNQHSLPVTSVALGVGGANGRIFTSSLDGTVKVWDIPSNRMIYSVVCPSPVRSLALDSMEMRLFFGCSDGQIGEISLDVAAVCTVSSSVRLSRGLKHDLGDLPESPLSPYSFCGHSAAVLSLVSSQSGDDAGSSSFSFAAGTDPSLLISGCEAGELRIWHVMTRQCIRILRVTTNKGPVSCILLLPQPPSAFISPPLSRLAPLAPFKKFRVFVDTAAGGGGATTLDADAVPNVGVATGRKESSTRVRLSAAEYVEAGRDGLTYVNIADRGKIAALLDAGDL